MHSVQLILAPQYNHLICNLEFLLKDGLGGVRKTCTKYKNSFIIHIRQPLPINLNN